MKNRILMTALIALGLVLGACGPAGDGREEPLRLDGTRWVLETMNGEAPLAGTTITAEFSEGQVSGNSGCNSYFGSYTLEDSEFTVSELVWTEMACLEPEGLMDQEQRYLSILNNATRLEKEANRLTLRTPDGRGLVFAPQS